MKKNILLLLISLTCPVFAQLSLAPITEIVFQVQNATAEQRTYFTYSSSPGTAILFDASDCVYTSASDYSFTHTIWGSTTFTTYFAHIVLSNEYPLSIPNFIHALVKIEVKVGAEVKHTFYYDTRDCNYYTHCNYVGQDITLRYDYNSDKLFFKAGVVIGGTASVANGWQDVSGTTSKTYWGVAGIEHCALDFAGAPATPTGFYISGGNGQHPTLHWDANVEPDLAGYKIYTSHNGSPYSFLVYVNSSQTSFTDQSVTIGRIGTLVCYKISAYDAESLESEKTTAVCVSAFEISKEDQIDFDNEMKIFDYKLYDAYPNPFNPLTKIQYDLFQRGYVSLKIYDMLGNEVATLIDLIQDPGGYSVSFSADNLASGFYFYMLRVNNFKSAKKLLLTK